MSSLPPSHRGRFPLIAAPNMASRMLNTMTGRNDWRSTLSAPRRSEAPMRLATCTENPEATAEQSPHISHVDVAISPIDADDSAPSEPTIAASIYCMTMVDSCATIAGHDSTAVRRSCWRSDISCPRRIMASRLSLSIAVSPSILLQMRRYGQFRRLPLHGERRD